MIFVKISLRSFWTHALLIAALIAVCSPGHGLAETTPTFSHYIEQFASGRIDWDSGQIYGVGRAYLDANDNSPIKARKAADLMASASIIRLATGIRLDDKQTMAALGHQKTTLRIEALLRDELVQNTLIDDGKRPYFEATRMAAMHGISGLTANLISALRHLDVEWLPKEPRSPAPPASPDDDEPWLVLDARKLPAASKIQPALFPKIISEDGEVLYELSQVDARALTRRGMARYVLSNQDLNSQGATIGTLAATLLDILDHLVGPQQAEAGDKEPRKKRCRYIIKEVKQAAGLTQTTLMISAQDAKTVKEENRSSKILKKCRVIVVMSSPIGGIEGSIPSFLAQLRR